MQQRFESESLPESPSAYVEGPESSLSSDRVDRLLAEPLPEAEGLEARTPAPMEGIWLGVAVGVILWAVIAGIVLLV